MEGVHEGAQVSEASLQVRQRAHAEPWQEEAGTDVGLEQEAEVVEGTLPAKATVPLWVGQEHRVCKGRGRWRGRCGDCGEGRTLVWRATRVATLMTSSHQRSMAW